MRTEKDLAKRLVKSRRRLKGEDIVISKTGEEGVLQMRALLGLDKIVTNVNIPNVGQIPNLPLGAVVETNAVFSDYSVRPVQTGELPMNIYPLISRIVSSQELVVDAICARDIDAAFVPFVNDPLVTIGHEDARRLFDEMVENTSEYLGMYNKERK